MQLSDVTNLVKLLDKSGLAEMRFSDGTFSRVLKKESRQVAAAPVDGRQDQTDTPRQFGQV